jgi:hypothetical protein
VQEFLSFVLNRSSYNEKVFCHSGSTFDFRFIINELTKLIESSGTGVYITNRDKKLITLEVVSDSRKVVFSDSYLLTLNSLENLVKSMLGIKTEKNKHREYFMNYSLEEFLANKNLMEDYVLYNQSDTKYLYDIMLKVREFVDVLGLDFYNINTIPSLAYNA